MAAPQGTSAGDRDARSFPSEASPRALRGALHGGEKRHKRKKRRIPALCLAGAGCCRGGSSDSGSFGLSVAQGGQQTLEFLHHFATRLLRHRIAGLADLRRHFAECQAHSALFTQQAEPISAEGVQLIERAPVALVTRVNFRELTIEIE